jgi:hypothetical protein
VVETEANVCVRLEVKDPVAAVKGGTQDLCVKYVAVIEGHASGGEVFDELSPPGSKVVDDYDLGTIVAQALCQI